MFQKSSEEAKEAHARLKNAYEILMHFLQEDDSGTTTPSSTHSRTPVAGHVSSLRASESDRKISSNVKDASNKHMDPRTGTVEQGPSRMGFDSSNQNVNEGGAGESSSNNVLTKSRTENTNNHSFKGSRLDNVKRSGSSNRTKNGTSANTQQSSTYQSTNENFPTNPILDSAYGSLDKLKTDGGSQTMRSPVLSRRLPNKGTVRPFGNSFDSDEVDGCNERGSSGFVNTIGMAATMKDTAYDYVRLKK